MSHMIVATTGMHIISCDAMGAEKPRGAAFDANGYLNTEECMEVNMGSNVLRDTNGVFKVEGKDQVLLEIDPTPQMLLTMDVYDPKGIHVAKVIRNKFAFDYKDRYRMIAKPLSLMLVDREHNVVLIEASLTDTNNKKIQVMQGNFYSSKGHLIEINARCWRVMGTTVGGTVFDCHGGAIFIGR